MKPSPHGSVAMLAVVLVSCVVGRAGAQDLRITNTRVVDVVAGSIGEATDVAVRAGRIAEIGPGAGGDWGGESIDAQGGFLLPGLWDAHVHLANRPDPPLAPERQLEIYLSYGVTSVRDMGGDPAVLVALRQRAASGEIDSPRISMAGPFLDGAGEPPVFRAITTPADAPLAIAELREQRVDFAKVQARLGVDEYRAVVKEARAGGLTLAGHVPDAVSALEVIAAGQRTIEHVSPALPSDAGLLFACSPREAELREELESIGRYSESPDADRTVLLGRIADLRMALLTERTEASCRGLFEALREHSVFVVPTLVWSQGALTRGVDDVPPSSALSVLPADYRTRLVEGRVRYAEAAPRERLVHHQAVARESQRFVHDLHQAGVTVVAGTDSFDGSVLPGFSLLQELELFVGAGLTAEEALRSATIDAARMALREAELGSVEVGKSADLILVRSNPFADIANLGDLEAVIRDGRLYTSARLDALRAPGAADRAP